MPKSWRQHLRDTANRVLHPLGLHVDRRERCFDMCGLLARAAARGPAIRTWVDVGASDGIWSLAARRHFPSAEFILFEPLEEHRPALARHSAKHGFHIVNAAAGPAAGEIVFAVDPALDGSGVASPEGAGPTRRVPVATIDSAVSDRGLAGPFALKLDTHGFELPVLEGAARTLESTELLVIEAYAFQLAPGTLRFHELCAWLAARGFACCDLADPMRRPSDGALWQLDLAFVRTTHPLFATARYS
jgi:FkbM family methyltransferase